jgi:hypothetical protein
MSRIELFDGKSSNSIFITSNEYGFVEVFYSLCSDAHPTGVLGWVGMLLYRRRRNAGTSTSSVTAFL